MAYYLNPKYHYKYGLRRDHELLKAAQTVISKLVKGVQDQINAMNEINSRGGIMDGVAVLQSSMSSLSLTSSSFLGQRFSPSFLTVPVKTVDKTSTITMAFKHWEGMRCKPNSLPLLHKMHVKVGDTVKVIAGRDKGKIGEIARIFRHNSTVIVKDINLKTKHLKGRSKDEPGQIIMIEAPIHSSNVMLYSKEKQVASRVGHKILEDGSRVRYLIKTGEIIDSAEKWKQVIKERKSQKEAKAAA